MNSGPVSKKPHPSQMVWRSSRAGPAGCSARCRGDGGDRSERQGFSSEGGTPANVRRPRGSEVLLGDVSFEMRA